MRDRGARNLGAFRGQIDNQINTFKRNQQNNITNNALNNADRSRNQTNAGLNAGYNRVLQVANNTKGGDYTDQRALIRAISSVPESVKKNFEKDYKAFYQTEKLVQWDNKLGALDPLGKFDGKWYYGQDAALQDKWEAAKADDDIDITERYGSTDNWAWFNYTSRS